MRTQPADRQGCRLDSSEGSDTPPHGNGLRSTHIQAVSVRGRALSGRDASRLQRIGDRFGRGASQRGPPRHAPGAPGIAWDAYRSSTEGSLQDASNLVNGIGNILCQALRPRVDVLVAPSLDSSEGFTREVKQLHGTGWKCAGLDALYDGPEFA